MVKDIFHHIINFYLLFVFYLIFQMSNILKLIEWNYFLFSIICHFHFSCSFALTFYIWKYILTPSLIHLMKISAVLICFILLLCGYYFVLFFVSCNNLFSQILFFLLPSLVGYILLFTHFVLALFRRGHIFFVLRGKIK